MAHSLNTNTVSSWDIDGGLAADFDGSLSGLGTEIGTNTYNMRYSKVQYSFIKVSLLLKGPASFGL